MKVKDLLKILESVNPNMEVYCTSNSGSYDYGKVGAASTQSLVMLDGDGFAGFNWKEKTVLVIEEKE